MQVCEIAKSYAKFYEELTPATKREEYAIFFDQNSEFSDPFKSVKGLDPICNIFFNMYETLHKPRFIVDEIVCSKEVTYIKWQFCYSRNKSAPTESFTGVTRVTFTASNKVKSHVDYWDAAQNVYEKIPLLGSVLRYIKRKIHAQ